jgi:hypothetical protein
LTHLTQQKGLDVDEPMAVFYSMDIEDVGVLFCAAVSPYYASMVSTVCLKNGLVGSGSQLGTFGTAATNGQLC